MPREKRTPAVEAEMAETRTGRKREKYTRIACETCKTRKVKCSGQVPCSRCVELNAQCRYQEYPPPLYEVASEHSPSSSQTAKRRRMSNTSNPELGQLINTMKKVCEDIESSASNYSLASIPASSLKRTQRYSVATRPTRLNPRLDYIHTLEMAREVLETKGLHRSRNEKNPSSRNTLLDNTTSTSAVTDTLLAAKPILSIGRDKVLLYLSTFKEHVYPAYPCINLAVARGRVEALFSTDTPQSSMLSPDIGLELIDVEIMKVTCAISMLLRGEEESPLCQDLTGHLLWNTDAAINEELQIEDIIISTMVTIYLIIRKKEVQSWRMIGFSARACLELGLHREKPAEEPSQLGSQFRRLLFSCVYDLDKRCSFVANLPWTLQENDIDDEVLSVDNQFPFLSAMLALNRVHTEIVRFNTTSPMSGNRETREKAEIFDYRIQKLADVISARGVFPVAAAGPPPIHVQTVMSSILQLRAKHVRMLAYMRYLNGSNESARRSQPIDALVSLAISSVDVCLGLSNASPLWRPFVDRLLMATLSYLFLTVSQNPAKYGSLCRKAYHSAIDCLSQASYELSVAEVEVWGSLDELRKLGEKIKMPSIDESTSGTETTPSLETVAILEGDHQFSVPDLAQLYDGTSQDPISALWNIDTLWDNPLAEFSV